MEQHEYKFTQGRRDFWSRTSVRKGVRTIMGQNSGNKEDIRSKNDVHVKVLGSYMEGKW